MEASTRTTKRVLRFYDRHVSAGGARGRAGGDRGDAAAAMADRGLVCAPCSAGRPRGGAGTAVRSARPLEAKRTVNGSTPARATGAQPTDRRATLLPLRSEREANGTMASTVADAIIADVVARGWPEGEVLGSEADLLNRVSVMFLDDPPLAARPRHDQRVGARAQRDRRGGPRRRRRAGAAPHAQAPAGRSRPPHAPRPHPDRPAPRHVHREAGPTGGVRHPAGDRRCRLAGGHAPRFRAHAHGPAAVGKGTCSRAAPSSAPGYFAASSAVLSPTSGWKLAM